MLAGPGFLDQAVQQRDTADLLLIEGYPFADISVLTRPSESLVVIMEGGKLYKNALAELSR